MSKWKWTTEEQNAFKALKEALVSAPVLWYPNVKQRFQLCCDTSLYAIGACLEQTSDGQNWHVVAYGSKALDKTQSNWSATEREGYAIVFFLNKWRHLLLGAELEVLSDHHALQWLFDQKELIGKIVKWIMKVQEFFLLWITH